MGKFSNRAQVVYAATCWVFGGDNTLTGQEQSKMKEAINRSKTPWSLSDEDAHWVESLFTSGKIKNYLDDIINAINCEFEFSLQDKYFLYSCVCIPMHELAQGSNSKDGWDRAGELRRALDIDFEDYNRWAQR
jgi:hypothetical protein